MHGRFEFNIIWYSQSMVRKECATQIAMATSAQRPSTLTQQATQGLIRETLATLTGPPPNR